MMRSILLVWLLAAPVAAQEVQVPGEGGGPGEIPSAGGEGDALGLAVACAKALVCSADPRDPQVVDNALVLVRDGKIVSVEARGASGDEDWSRVPEGYALLDLGKRWILPGMIDLHSHIAGSTDWHQNVYLTNPGLRVNTSVVTENEFLQRALAGGVTAVLYIPGSGTNIGGQGVLLRNIGGYEAAELRSPGSMKLAQAGNPERWGVGVNRAFMNWNLRSTLRRGIAYAKRWEAYHANGGERPRVDLQFEVFRALHRKSTQLSVHTQMYQVVMMTLSMLRVEFDLDAYIDHGSFDGYRAAGRAQEVEVDAILGPRMLCWTYPGFLDTDGRAEGMAARYQEGGHRAIGFNTDAIDPDLLPAYMRGSVVPTEELSLQAAMSARYGMERDRLETVRGLTIVPAIASGLDDRLGSLEPGKEADFLVVTGDPADPRNGIELVYIGGERVYDAAKGRRW